MESGRKGKHGTVGAVPTEEQRNHGSCFLRRPFALRRRLGAGKPHAVRRTKSLSIPNAGTCFERE